MNAASQSAPNEVLIDLFVAVCFMAAGLIYIIPGIVAFWRGHPNRWIILIINVVFGTTILGWGIALIWALRAVHRTGSVSSGGESGLNLFVNDVKRIQIVDPPPLSKTSPIQELERLHDLFIRGVITQLEFDNYKANLLGRVPSH